MKKIFGWLTSNVLLAFMYFAVALSIIMLILYFATFNGWFNEIFVKWGFYKISTEWSNFGSYFGSITGLLAFAGVLYTAWQSEQRAEKAEEQVRNRDERDLFFKMLDLYQKHRDLVTCGDDIGIEAFKSYGTTANESLEIYVALNELINNIDGKPTRSENMQSFYVAVNSIWCKLSTEDECYEENFKDFIIGIRNKKQLDYLYDCYDKAQSCSEDIMNSMKKEDKYLAIRYVADSINEKYGHLFGQYYRNIYYLMDMISKSGEEKKYSKIFRAQLSRYELLLLLYNAVSSQSSLDSVEYLIKYDIFNNIVSDDIIMYDYFKCDIDFQPESISRSILRDFVNEILVEYQKDYRNIEYSWQP